MIRFVSTLFVGILLAGLVMIPTLHAEESTFRPQETFNMANYTMDQGNVDEAMAMYREILSRGYVSGPLLTNIGLGYIKKDSLGLAKSYFIQATEFSQSRQRASELLSAIDRNLQSRTGTLPVLTIYAMEQQLRFDWGARYFFLWGIFLLNLGTAFGIWYFLRKKHIRPLFWTSLGIVVIGFIATILAWYLHITENHHSQAVVIAREITLFEEYDTTSLPVGLAYEGFTITLDHRKQAAYPGWVYVRMSNGLTGWVQMRHIRTL